MGLGLHLIDSDNELLRRWRVPFENTGRYALASALVVGWLLSALTQTREEVGDVIIALLAGFIFSNVFRDDLPQEQRKSYPAFLAGVITFLAISLAVRGF